MKKRLWGRVGMAAGALTLAAGSMWGQDSADKVTVPFRDASKPKTLVVNTMNGSIVIRGGSGNDAVIESAAIARESSRRDRFPGMHQIAASGAIDVSEENNVVTVRT